MGELLSETEMAGWTAFKHASESVMDAVGAEIGAATGLSVADFSVLTRVVEAPGGRIRQQRLSEQLGWGRSRLSRQLDRMERRGLLRRTGTTAAREIVPTADGEAITARARVAHACAVRSALLHVAPPDDDPFWSTIGAIAARKLSGPHDRLR